MWHNHFGKLATAIKTKYTHTPTSCNSLLEQRLKEVCSYAYQKTHTRMFMAVVLKILGTGRNVHLHRQLGDEANCGLFKQWTTT